MEVPVALDFLFLVWFFQYRFYSSSSVRNYIFTNRVVLTLPVFLLVILMIQIPCVNLAV